MNKWLLSIIFFGFSIAYSQPKTWKYYCNKASVKFATRKYSSAYTAINRAFALLPDTTPDFFKANKYENEIAVDSLYFMRAIIKTIIGDTSSVSDFHKMRDFYGCFPYYHDSLNPKYPGSERHKNQFVDDEWGGWIQSDPFIVETLIDIARDFGQENNSFIKSKRCFQMVFVLQPDSVEGSSDALFGLCCIGAKFRKNKFCVEVCRQFLSRFPNEEDTFNLKAVYGMLLNSLVNQNKYNDIMPVVNTMIERGMDEKGYLYLVRAVVNLNKKNNLAACADFNKAIDLGFKIKKKTREKKIFCASD